MELRANLEVGQALLRSPLGESFGGAMIEMDLDGAEEAYRRVIELAEQLGDDRNLAGALREVGMIDFSRGRGWFTGEVRAGRGQEILAAVAAGADFETIILATPAGPYLIEALEVLERALAIFERLGDRTGVMSTVIAMAYARYGPLMHLNSSARHLEEIRRVTSRLSELVTESERARLELQMLFGVHVYSRAKIVPDLALSRGEDAHRAARLQGDRGIEFLAAGGVAMSQLELGDIDEAERWLGLAAAAGSASPSRTRARQLETWRGIVRAGAGDVDGMRTSLERAVAIATEEGRASARCEALARLAIEAARFVTVGSQDGSEDADPGGPDPAIVDLVERSAAQVKELLPLLPGHAPWGAQADAALAAVALAHGDIPAAAMAGGAVFEALQAGLHEDASLDIVIPAARGILAGAPPEVQDGVRGFLRSTLSRIAQGTADETIRVRWLTGPVGRELAALAGPMDMPAAGTSSPADAGGVTEAAGPNLDEAERRLLQLLTEGRTNAEIAAELDCNEDDVAQRLARLYARLGTSSRAEATSLAFRGLAAVGSR
jgi:DNA-binding NarL/FixJ family response regulator